MVSDGERPPLCRVSSPGFLLKRIIPRVNSRQAEGQARTTQARRKHTSFSFPIPSWDQCLESTRLFLNPPTRLPVCRFFPVWQAILPPSPNTSKQRIVYQSQGRSLKQHRTTANLSRLIDIDSNRAYRDFVELFREECSRITSFRIRSDFD